MNLRVQSRPAMILFCLMFVLCRQLAAQQTEEPQAPTFEIEVKVNKVLVPVVVRDAQGRTVGSLRKEDFQVFDRNEAQTISAFDVQTRGTINSETERGSPAIPNASKPTLAPPERFIAFLIDDLHLSTSELGKVQRLGMKMLAGSLTDSDMAAVVSISGINSGLTRDRAKLEEAIMNLKSQPLYRHESRQCPDVDYYNADLIENKRDGAALEAAVQQTLACANLDPKTMRNVAENMVRSAAASTAATGDQDVRVTLSAIRDFVRKMGTLPGQRTLILVSPGFLTLTPEAMTWKTEILDLAARSNVTISALDVRGLYTTEIGADERGPDSAVAMQTGNESQSHRNSMAQNEDVMAELADGSGGKYFHNSNDLEKGFHDLAAVADYVYVLELSLDHVKSDGKYHPLKVRVDQEGLKVQARRGYFAPKLEKNKSGKEPGKTKEEKGLENAKRDVLRGSPAKDAAGAPPNIPADTKTSESKIISRSLNWAPPLVDTPLHPGTSSPPCVLSAILEQAGARAAELYTNLESFSAQEQIEYQASDHMGYLQDARTGTFDYVVLFQQSPGGTNVQESRQPKHGSRLLTVFTQDVGEPEMALMFLPEIQSDYEMNCEGAVEWNGQSAQVVRFAQRKDRPSHTLSFRDSKGAVYPAKLKGRAWIAAASGEVIHLELSLMQEIPKARVRHWYLSIDYAPVQFRAQNVRMLLPLAVDVFCDFEDHRTIVYHTFRDFKLFSVQTDEATTQPTAH